MEREYKKNTEEQYAQYREKVRKEMMKLGAFPYEYNILETLNLENAIKNNYDPKDVAWAIMQ